MRDFKRQHEAFNKKTEDDKDNALATASGVASAEECNLYEEMSIMTELSALIYTVAYLVDIVGKGGYEVSSSWWPWSTPERKQLEKTSLVIVDKCPIDGSCQVALKKKLPAKNVTDFVAANEELLSNDPEITGDAEEDDIHPRTMLTLSAMKNSANDGNYIWCFDHRFGGTGLVYGVTVNRDMKRVTVVFRGSQTGEDWSQNFQVLMADLKTPHLLKDLGFDEDIKVHGGFMGYLLDDDVAKMELSEENFREKKPGKYGQILLDLEECFNHEEDGVKVHEGFNLYVAGHSLGGALSTLLAMKLASSRFLKENINAAKTIINMSVASPYVGNQAFHNAIMRLEKEDWLRHIRVTNQGDVVPVAPPKRFLWNAVYEPYVHTGLNVHLLKGKGKIEIGYDINRTFASQFSLSSADRHAVDDYWDSIKDDKESFAGKSASALYETYFPK